MLELNIFSDLNLSNVIDLAVEKGVAGIAEPDGGRGSEVATGAVPDYGDAAGVDCKVCGVAMEVEQGSDAVVQG